MRTCWDELLRDHLKQSRSNKALQKSLFSYKVRLPCASTGVFFMPNFEKFNVILSAGAGALRVSGLLVEELWSNPE